MATTTPTTTTPHVSMDTQAVITYIKAASVAALKRVGVRVERAAKTSMKKGGVTTVAYTSNPLQRFKAKIKTSRASRKAKAVSSVTKKSLGKARQIAMRNNKKVLIAKEKERIKATRAKIQAKAKTRQQALKNKETFRRNVEDADIMDASYWGGGGVGKLRKKVSRSRASRKQSLKKSIASVATKAKQKAPKLSRTPKLRKPVTDAGYKKIARELRKQEYAKIREKETGRREKENVKLKMLRTAGYKSSRRVQIPSEPGTPPHTQTGHLRTSITSAVDSNKAQPSVVVGAIAKYGKVHEHGGSFTIKAHTRTIHKRWGVALKKPCVQHVPAHTAHYPARPFMQPALEKVKAEILEEFKGAMAKK